MKLNFFQIVLFIVSLVMSESFYAQQSNFNTMRNWTKNKKEIFFGTGVNQYMGDLGGFEKFGTDYSFSSNSFLAQGVYPFRFHPYWATSSRIQIGKLNGNDAFMNDEFRQSRNLHFRSY